MARAKVRAAFVGLPLVQPEYRFLEYRVPEKPRRFAEPASRNRPIRCASYSWPSLATPREAPSAGDGRIATTPSVWRLLHVFSRLFP